MRVRSISRRPLDGGSVVLREACERLEAARQWFDWITDPRDVDEAVWRVGAAERALSRTLRPLRTGLAPGKGQRIPPQAHSDWFGRWRAALRHRLGVPGVGSLQAAAIVRPRAQRPLAAQAVAGAPLPRSGGRSRVEDGGP